MFFFLFFETFRLILSCKTLHYPKSYYDRYLRVISSNISWLKAAGQVQNKNMYL